MEFRLDSPAATEALGAALCPVIRAHAGGVVYLEGDLGSGKTTLVRGLLRAAGVDGTIRSPTYTLLEPYEIDGKALIHLDFYRLRGPAELVPLGLEDYPPDRCWWLVEWPGRGAGLVPEPDLRIGLRPEGSGRSARVSGRWATPEVLRQLQAGGGAAVAPQV